MGKVLVFCSIFLRGVWSAFVMARSLPAILDYEVTLKIEAIYFVEGRDKPAYPMSL